MVLFYRENANPDEDKRQTKTVVKLLNNCIKTRLKEQLLAAKYEQAHEWYGTALRLGLLKPPHIAGFMYRVLLLRKWMESGKVCLDLRDHAQRTPPREDATYSPEYQFPFAENKSQALEIKVDGVKSDGEYIPKRVGILEDNVLYFPYKTDSEAIDFFIRDRATETSYGFSATVSNRHVVKDGLYAMLRGLELLEQPVKGKYVHVTVQDRKEHLSVPCPIWSPKSTEKDKRTAWQGQFPFRICAAYLPCSREEEGIMEVV